MSILVDQLTRVVVQGITGTEGSRAAKEMLAYGTAVLAGVRPGKAGESVHGVPVYHTVADAVATHPPINTSLVVVPAPHVVAAVEEAITARIPLIVVLTEHVPVAVGARLIVCARAVGIRVVGPSSVGIISPGKGKVGAIGSSEVAHVFQQGRIGVVSKSGGMTAEIAVTLQHAGLGISTAVGIGGDMLIGTDFVDILRLFQDDEGTDAVVLFGEVGGTYEEEAAALVASGACMKPIVAVIAGRFTETLPLGTTLGHAGAIVARGRGSYRSKVEALRRAGVRIADRLEEIPVLLQQTLYARQIQHAVAVHP